MNKVTVNIQGLEFTLKGEESEEHLTRIGETVDGLLGTMIKSNRKLNVSTAAILTSCNLVDDKFRLEQIMKERASKDAEVNTERLELQKEILALQASIRENEKKSVALAREEAALIRKKEDELSKLQSEMRLLQDSVKEYRDDNEELSKINKELKFELQSYKYKVLDLQNKLFENQLTITKDKKEQTAKE